MMVMKMKMVMVMVAMGMMGMMVTVVMVMMVMVVMLTMVKVCMEKKVSLKTPASKNICFAQNPNLHLLSPVPVSAAKSEHPESKTVDPSAGEPSQISHGC
jgi:hypothetical protein